MKKCVTRLLTLVVFTYFLCGCKRAESDSSEQLIVRLTEQARTYICENSDDALNTVIGENGIEISQILYGLLETDGEEEALLICKIPQMSHVGGLDRTIVVCYEMQSGRMHSLLDLPYDELDIVCVENVEKILRLLTMFFVKHFSPKRASEFPVFVKGISLLSAGHSYASRRMRACSIR